MSKLMLHHDSDKVERKIIVESPTPPGTRSHTPIPHIQLLKEVERTLNYHKYQVIDATHGLSHNSNRYFGLLQLSKENGDYGIVLGVRNSHDKSFPAGIVAGSRVFVCDNLAFSGEVRLARRHTTHIVRDLPQLMGRMVQKLGNFYHQQDEQIAAYKQFELSEDRARSLMVEAVRRGVIGCTHLPKVLEQWETPAHVEFDDPTVWRLFNAVTEVAKSWPDQQTVSRTQLLHGLCNAEVGLAV